MGWGNYRHQADVLHAYHVLKRGGLPDERIVVMVYDDLADSYENAFPGKVFNKPGGPDVYAGAPKDYTGADVTSETFLAVLAGDAEAVAGKGSGKVIASGPHDRVFVFYSDHGAAGVVGMPTGDFLYADEFVKTLRQKHRRHGFKEMVLYIEACESGSMFEGLLDNDLEIYATTASNAYESSWATYCPGFGAAELTTCLGDLYSVAWMEDSETSDLTVETLEQQYGLVRIRTSANFTYSQGSHVMQYGAMEIDTEPAGDYLGMYNNGSAPTPTLSQASSMPGMTRTMRQRDADLMPLYHKAATAASPRLQQQAMTELTAELGRRAALDDSVRATVRNLLKHPRYSAPLQQHLQSGGAAKPAVAASQTVVSHCPEAALSELLNGSFGRPSPGRPLVDDWDCLRGMVAAWQSQCGALGQYGMRHTRLFANLCNAGIAPGALLDTAIIQCALPAAAEAA